MAKEIQKNNQTTRPPIVVVMGHIDHGKTTFLDYIRKTKVTEGEAGGITQHAAAYEIETNDRKISFIDTPGHEAFANIRRRGAKIADIAVLIIAADDKVNEQTIESIEAIKETEMPFVVAINKIDKETANAEKIKKELSEQEIYVEEWGGKIPCVEISAKTGQNINDLLEIINLMADLEEFKTDANQNASGFVLESHKDPKRGTAATLLIHDGNLKQGMQVVSGNAMAPVRIFEDFNDKAIKEAGASTPVKIYGFNEPPKAGDEFSSFKNKKEAEAFIAEMEKSEAQKEDKETIAATDEQVVIPLIIKTDVLGSKEAFEKQLKKIETEKVVFNILRADVGDINENDIKLASSGTNAIILGFNVSCPGNIKLLAEQMKVDIQLFDIIYKAEDWLKEEVERRKPLEEREEIIGKAKIIKIFRDEKNKKIIGGEVLEGKVANGKAIKIYRRDFMLGEGKITELKSQQTKVEEMNEGEQFGAMIQTRAAVEPKDRIEVIEKVVE